MHHIQRSILGKLMGGEALRYAELKPSDIGSNLFTYHLKVLKDLGYVQRTGWGTYTLTSTGKRYVDTLSLQTLRSRVQPRIVILLACRDRLGRWLLLKRKIQPLLGQAGFPYGKLHKGELLKDAAQRILLNKTGLTGDLEHKGDGYITISEDKKAVSEIFFHLFYCMAPSGYLIENHEAGKVFWGDMESDFSEGDFMASMADLVALIDTTPKGERFFAELSYGDDAS
ncbi:NUDIX domain-containing protein [bacterium]|nr:NUDIX domain-containing protein [bacterium]